MIDLRLLRTDPDRVRESLQRRDADIDLDEIISLDERHRALLTEVESLRAQQNQVSKEIASSSGPDRELLIEKGRELSERLKKLEAEQGRVKSDLDDASAWIPNLVHPKVPSGTSEDDNVVLREVGERRTLEFQPRDHLELGEYLGIIDVERAAKISGARFSILKGRGALLEIALVRFALERLAEKGFVPVIPPVLVREDVLFGMGFFPTFRNEAFEIARDNLFLVGTSEAPLAGMHAGEIIPSEQLPMRYAAFSSCFRREAGTYGKDTRGIIRLHQFEKVEMFVLCSPDESEGMHSQLLASEEEIFHALEVPYRVVDTCAGELGPPYSRKFDLEAWLPGANRWLEVTSCSNALDYQARRLAIRTKSDRETIPVHTLNGTAVTGRAIVAILENHQRPDGSVVVPNALRPYTGFESITPARASF